MSADIPVLYHYTSTAAFFNIIKEGCFHLSNIRDFADQREGKYLKKNLFSRSADDFFIMSLAKAKDDISLWERYADKGEGFSIGWKMNYFSFPDPCSVYYLSVHKLNELSGFLTWRGNTESQKAEICKRLEQEGLLREKKSWILVNQPFQTLACLKSESYKSEEEQRVILTKGMGAIKYKNNNNQIKQYLEDREMFAYIDHIYIGYKNKTRPEVLRDFMLESVRNLIQDCENQIAKPDQKHKERVINTEEFCIDPDFQKQLREMERNTLGLRAHRLRNLWLRIINDPNFIRLSDVQE